MDEEVCSLNRASINFLFFLSDRAKYKFVHAMFDSSWTSIVRYVFFLFEIVIVYPLSH